MLIIREASDIPLYLQLYQQIRDEIAAGRFPSCSKLPSSRQLAKELNVSRNTVEFAYQQLYAEGYLKSKPRSGFYVERLEPDKATAAAPERIPPPDDRSEPEEEPCRYDFQYGKLDPDCFPFAVWHKLTSQCLRNEKEGIMSYGDRQGEWGLRCEIAKYILAFRGIHCSPDQIVIGAGTQYCLSLLCQLIGAQTGAVAIEEPGHDGSRAVFGNYGFSIVPIGLEEDGIHVAQLEQSPARAVYITPSHQFPTGIIMPISKRLRLLEWAAKKNGIIIEDDYASHLRYNIKPIPSLRGIRNSENVVHVGSFSKSLSPALRLSYMVLPPALLDGYRRMFKDYVSTVPFLQQKTLELFMKEGHWERHLRRSTQLYKKKHELLLQSLQKYLGDRVAVYGKHAGVHLMLGVKAGLTEAQLIEKAAAEGVRVYPVSRHWFQPENYGDNMVLLGFSGIRDRDIDPGVRLLRKAWFGGRGDA
ncbi:MAG TPA: PLP-dependent aminotransferase family protein [Selenomonadales bacterium]|nr:PLP-dependent aminotransferase family protein [Selenomonadales bacterium]